MTAMLSHVWRQGNAVFMKLRQDLKHHMVNVDQLLSLSLRSASSNSMLVGVTAAGKPHAHPAWTDQVNCGLHSSAKLVSVDHKVDR